MSQGKAGERVRGPQRLLCDYLGISRQGYSKHADRKSEVSVLASAIVLYSQTIREQLPRAGMRELYACCKRYFGEKMVIGRDQCYGIFRANGLCLRRRRYRPRTTDSRHNFYIYPDLLNVTPKFTARHLGDMMVGDITYVSTSQGWAYLSLLTDAASRAIVGYALHPTLGVEGPMKALEMALEFYKEHGVDLSSLIHHSDRGIQYCSNRYVERLRGEGVRISMTQCGDPLHNALAERMNNTIKNGWLFDSGEEDFEQVGKRIDKAVYAYNHIRPHQGIGMKTPMEFISGEEPTRSA